MCISERWIEGFRLIGLVFGLLSVREEVSVCVRGGVRGGGEGWGRGGRWLRWVRWVEGRGGGGGAKIGGCVVVVWGGAG